MIEVEQQTAFCLETKRLVLRTFLEDDFAALHAILGDRDVMRFSVLGPLKEEQIKQFIRKEISVFQEKGMAILAVLCKVSGSLIGYCGVHWLNIDGEVLPELTYRFALPFWGKGFATEAAHAVKTYSIEKKQMSNLVSIIDPENVRSIRVAEKLGAVFWKETKYEHLHIRVYQHTL